jgi:dCMP deaminase
MRPTFPEWALGIALAASKRSEDPYLQVGSVVVQYDWMVVGVGYNGLPAGVDMPSEWWADRDGRRPFMIHAEVNALRSVVPTHDALMVVSTHIPCAACMSVIGSFRISVVYYAHLLGAAHDLDAIHEIAELMGIGLKQVVPAIGDRPTTPCEEWQGACFGSGYPARYDSVLKKPVSVHRWVIAQEVGWDAIAGAVIMHLCDNKLCIRRDHLMVGDYSLNAKDWRIKQKLDRPQDDVVD